MSLYIGSIVINVTDLQRAQAFWCAALGYVVRDAHDGPDFVVLTDPERRWANISLQLWPSPKTTRNRLHFSPLPVSQKTGLSLQLWPSPKTTRNRLHFSPLPVSQKTGLSPISRIQGMQVLGSEIFSEVLGHSLRIDGPTLNVLQLPL